ncbi:MAG TPA: hypothetical protein VF753_07010 [Terriglobales bacterium]
MQLGETIATYDVAVALRGESGKFEVTSPAGNIFRVTCKSNHSIANLEWADDGSEGRPFLIRKVAEMVSAHAGAVGSAPEATAPAPFLIESKEETKKADVEEVEMQTEPARAPSGAIDLELFYAERDPVTEQPAWGVCVKDPEGAATADALITAMCASYNELDAEIRRLHAQLDEIRSRARKSFYKAQAMAASA